MPIFAPDDVQFVTCSNPDCGKIREETHEDGVLINGNWYCCEDCGPGESKPCPRCGGKGEDPFDDEHTRSCPKCGGTGEKR